MEALKTLKGSKIQRSKYGVGKQMGNKIYIAIQYLPEICGPGLIKEAKMILNDHGIDYNSFKCACYDTKNPCVIRMDEVRGFDVEREPVVGWQYYVDTYNGTVKSKYCPQIFHHKFLWCKDDYTGFDVQAAYEWSKTWLQYITSPSGYLYKWNEELRAHGLPVDKEV